MICICLNRKEGALHNPGCSYRVQYDERIRAIKLLFEAFDREVTSEIFNDKAWVDADTVLDSLNKFRKTILLGDSIKVDKVEKIS